LRVIAGLRSSHRLMPVAVERPDMPIIFITGDAPMTASHEGGSTRIAHPSRASSSRANFSGMRKADSRAQYASRVGRFQLADGGTLFLDEVAETSVAGAVHPTSGIADRKLKRIISVRSLYEATLGSSQVA